ncbi:hypothetical protein ONS96_000964 [Cadophora gregata f. sp. sojae]|nr:hypothetical protein ONS96_000964 [Cadophora gregata f. sp. sojae]
MNSSTAQNPSGTKKPRASKPKVKSGCKTCKARRVKCDEKKPACDRCANFGRICGGYPSAEDPPPPKDPSPPVIRKLLSKPVEATSSSTPSLAQDVAFSPPPPIGTFVQPLPAGVAIQGERCYQYFCHFRDVTSFEFSSGFDPSLWRSLVLQACDNFAIGKLVVATAALSMFVKEPPQQTSELHLE